MSVSGSISFQTANIDSLVFNKITKALLLYGWSFDDEDKISYMVGDFDWENSGLSEIDAVMEKISHNIDKDLAAGITLLWQDSGIGGSFLFMDQERVSFSTIVRPLLLNESNVIDFSWYLEKLAPIFGIIYCERVICTHEY